MYTNTAALTSETGGMPAIAAVLLTTSDDAGASMVERRDVGGALGEDIRRSREVAGGWSGKRRDWFTHLAPDLLTMPDITVEVRRLTAW